MRRFSQRSGLVTLSEINITPLLDLAFVLLIIFVITTPLLEKGLDLNLPTLASATDRQVTTKDVKTVQITSAGKYTLENRAMTLDQVVKTLDQMHKANPNLVVDIRADKNGRMEAFTDLLDRCEQFGITRLSVKGVPVPVPR